jgi:hypothetical protein
MPSVFIIQATDIIATDTDGDPTALGSANQGAGSHLGELQIAKGAAFHEVEISDNGGRSDWLEDSTNNQVLTNHETIAGNAYTAGSAVEAEYQITLTDSAGTEYKAWALEVEDGAGSNYDNVVGLMFKAGEVPPFGETLTVTGNLDLYKLGSSNTEEFEYFNGVPCFTAGTLIDMECGPCPVQEVRKGMRILTADNGPQEVLWVGQNTLSLAELNMRPDLKPCVIQNGALGNARPLKVSPQHRLIVPSQNAFAAARALAESPRHRVRLAKGCRSVTYVHIFCAEHQVVSSEGMWSETLYPGPQALLAVGVRQRRELLSLFPELEDVLSAASKKEAKIKAGFRYGELARIQLTRKDLVA